MFPDYIHALVDFKLYYLNDTIAYCGQELKKMLLAGVLSIAIRAYFWHGNPRKTKEKRNWSNIDISVLSSTD